MLTSEEEGKLPLFQRPDPPEPGPLSIEVIFTDANGVRWNRVDWHSPERIEVSREPSLVRVMVTVEGGLFLAFLFAFVLGFVVAVPLG